VGELRAHELGKVRCNVSYSTRISSHIRQKPLSWQVPYLERKKARKDIPLEELKGKKIKKKSKSQTFFRAGVVIANYLFYFILLPCCFHL